MHKVHGPIIAGPTRCLVPPPTLTPYSTSRGLGFSKGGEIAHIGPKTRVQQLLRNMDRSFTAGIRDQNCATMLVTTPPLLDDALTLAHFPDAQPVVTKKGY